MPKDHPGTKRRRMSPLKIASYTSMAIGVLVLVCALVLLLFLDPLVNRYIKPRITRAFAEAYPAYSMQLADMNYSIVKNQFGLDFITLNAVDSTLSSTLGPISISGIGWMHLLWGGTLAPDDFAHSAVDVQNIVLTFPRSHYELRCERLQVSVPDSEIVIDVVKLHPLGDDEQFFSKSRFRETRFRLDAPHANVMGFAFLELLQGKGYHTRAVHIHDAILDVLVNKEKPNRKSASSPLMPNEILSSITESLHVDTLSIMNGRLKYSERFELGAKPAWITFDSMQLLAEGITNRGDSGAAMTIQAQWKLANAGTMKLLMSIPIASREFSIHYSGSLNSMDLSALNSFLEVSDQIRIKEGVLQWVTFEIRVASGRARGTVRGVYHDLTIAAIDKDSGSEKGFSNRITSFIANVFTIRRHNEPDDKGLMKIGEVKYTRQREDSFIQVVWFSLRTGVRDVVGF